MMSSRISCTSKRARMLFHMAACSVILTAGCLPSASARILLLHGDMKTQVTSVDSRTLHIPPGVRRLRVLVPEYPSFTAGPNQQQVIACQTRFSVPPTETQLLTDSYGNRYTDAAWDNPPPGLIYQRTESKLGLSLHAAPLHTPAPFPVSRDAIPPDVLPYLSGTALTQTDDPAIRSIAAQIAGRKDIHSQQAIVDAAVSWVVDHLRYGPERDMNDAVSTLRTGGGDCTGYSHLAIAILRALGIPARFAAGLEFREPYTVMGAGKFYSIDGQVSKGFLYHAWIQVYFPGEGWVEYDPQGDFGLVDTRRILFAVAPDKASLPEGRMINTFSPLADPSVFSEELSASVYLESDVVDLQAQAVVERGPLRDGTYIARATG